MPKHRTQPSRFVSTLGILGYFSCFIQWLWSAVIILPSLLGSNFVHSFVDVPQNTPAAGSYVHFSPPPAVALVIGAVVTAIVLLVTIVTVIRLPFVATQRTKKTVDISATKAITITTKHHQLPKQRERLLRARYIALFKLVITVLPLLLLLVVPILHISLETSIVVVAGVFFASWTIAWFSLQYIVAWATKTPLSKL